MSISYSMSEGARGEGRRAKGEGVSSLCVRSILKVPPFLYKMSTGVGGWGGGGGVHSLFTYVLNHTIKVSGEVSFREVSLFNSYIFNIPKDRIQRSVSFFFISFLKLLLTSIQENNNTW